MARTRGTREPRCALRRSADRADDDAPSFAPERFRSGSSLATGPLAPGPGPRRGRSSPPSGSRPPRPWPSCAAAIAALPERQRAVITLRDVDGWTAAEVCDLLDLSEANQRVLLHRARARVRQALEDDVTGSR